jgi:hypothetical protein
VTRRESEGDGKGRIPDRDPARGGEQVVADPYATGAITWSRNSRPSARNAYFQVTSDHLPPLARQRSRCVRVPQERVRRPCMRLWFARRPP